MEIQTPSPPRPSLNALEQDCRNHFRVAARRQTAANFSTLPQPKLKKLVALRLCASVAKTPSFRPVTRIRSDVPALTPLATRTMQKPEIPLNSTSFLVLSQGKGGVKCRILNSPASPCVGICRNIFQNFRACPQNHLCRGGWWGERPREPGAARKLRSRRLAGSLAPPKPPPRRLTRARP